MTRVRAAAATIRALQPTERLKAFDLLREFCTRCGYKIRAKTPGSLVCSCDPSRPVYVAKDTGPTELLIELLAELKRIEGNGHPEHCEENRDSCRSCGWEFDDHPVYISQKREHCTEFQSQPCTCGLSALIARFDHSDRIASPYESGSPEDFAFVCAHYGSTEAHARQVNAAADRILTRQQQESERTQQ